MREKLIELLDVAATIANNICSGIACEDCDGYNNGCTLNHMADHLIANGVTIQKWIPVTERLPETTCINLALIGELPYLAYYDGKQWRSNSTLRVLPVDYWMPLPEAPKGE